MKIVMTPAIVRMAEELTRARAFEHGGSMVVAFNGAAEYAALLEAVPEFAEHAKARADLYVQARAAIENVFQGLDAKLQELSAEAHAAPPAAAEAAVLEPTAALRVAIGSSPPFIQPCRLIVRYEDDLEEHRLPIHEGRVQFGMTGKLTGVAFLEDATGRREPVDLSAVEVTSATQLRLDESILSRLAPLGVVPIQKRDRRS